MLDASQRAEVQAMIEAATAPLVEALENITAPPEQVETAPEPEKNREPLPSMRGFKSYK